MNAIWAKKKEEEEKIRLAKEEAEILKNKKIDRISLKKEAEENINKFLTNIKIIKSLLISIPFTHFDSTAYKINFPKLNIITDKKIK